MARCPVTTKRGEHPQNKKHGVGRILSRPPSAKVRPPQRSGLGDFFHEPIKSNQMGFFLPEDKKVSVLALGPFCYCALFPLCCDTKVAQKYLGGNHAVTVTLRNSTMAARRAISARDSKVREDLIRRGNRRTRGGACGGGERAGRPRQPNSNVGTGVLSHALSAARWARVHVGAACGLCSSPSTTVRICVIKVVYCVSRRAERRHGRSGYPSRQLDTMFVQCEILVCLLVSPFQHFALELRGEVVDFSVRRCLCVLSLCLVGLA